MANAEDIDTTPYAGTAGPFAPEVAAALDAYVGEPLALRTTRKPLPSEPKPRRRDIGGPFAFDVVH